MSRASGGLRVQCHKCSRMRPFEAMIPHEQPFVFTCADCGPACARCTDSLNITSHRGSRACRLAGSARSIAAGGFTVHCTCAGCF